jgi:hypothetical protein
MNTSTSSFSKKLHIIFILTIGFLSSNLFASRAALAEVSPPVLRKVFVDQVYTPMGFDTNDDTQIVVTGNLPSVCYQAPKSVIKRVGKKIEVTVWAYYRKDTVCTQILVPFMEVISLGLMKSGDYEVTSENPNGEIRSNFEVSPSRTPAVDQFIYANLNTIVSHDGSQKVTLMGYNPSDCYTLDEVKMIFNGKNTYSILPIMKQVRDHCPRKMTPMSFDIELPEPVAEDAVLLHVRIMSGKSINQIHRTKLN